MKILDRVKAAFAAFNGRTGAAVSGASVSGRATAPRIGDQWLEAFNTMPWLRATVGKIAFGVASLQWGLTRTMAAGKTVRRRDLQKATFVHRQKALSAMIDEGNAEPVFEHPMLDLLADPCPLLEGKAFWILAQVYFEIAGEVFMLVERDSSTSNDFSRRGVPRALYLVPPTWVVRTPSPERPTFDIQRGALNMTEIPTTELLWLKNADPVNPYARGIGSALSLSDELDADESAARMVSWSFYNRGQGDMLVSLKDATPKDLDAFRNAWQSNLIGVTNALKTHFVNVEAKVEKLQHDFEHLQVLELRKYTRDTVRQVQAIPPEVLGITESSNRATIEAADFLFGKNVVIPRAEIWREFLQQRLVPEFDPRAVLDYVSPLFEDKEFSLKVAAMSPHAFRVNEARRLGGFDPLPKDAGGELFIVNGAAYESLNELIGATPATPGGLLAPFSLNMPGAGGPAALGGPKPKVTLELTAGAPRAKRALVDLRTSPDEAIAIARWAERCGYRIDFEKLADFAPVPVSEDLRLEYLRRALARLRGDSTAAWDRLHGSWTDADDDMLDRLLGVKEWAEDGTAA